ADVGHHRQYRRVAAPAVHDRALRVEGDALGAEPARQPLGQLGELLLVHLAHREQHDEQHHEQRQHVGVRDQPALVALVLLVVPTMTLLPGGHPLMAHTIAPLRGAMASPGTELMMSSLRSLMPSPPLRGAMASPGTELMMSSLRSLIPSPRFAARWLRPALSS